MNTHALAAIAVLGLGGSALLSLDTKKTVCADASVAVAYAALLKEETPATEATSAPVATLELPDDGRQWHTIYVFDERRYTDPLQRRLAAWFATDARLQQLVAQTVLHVYDPTSQRFAYYKSKGAMPQVCVVRDDGEVAYFATADKLPASEDELVTAIAAGLKSVGPPKPPVKPAGSAPAGSQPAASPQAVPSVPAVPAQVRPQSKTGAVQRTIVPRPAPQ